MKPNFVKVMPQCNIPLRSATFCYVCVRKHDRLLFGRGIKCTHALNPSSRNPPFENFSPATRRGFFCLELASNRYNYALYF